MSIEFPNDTLLAFIKKIEYYSDLCKSDCPEFDDDQIFSRPNDFIRKANFASKIISPDSLYLADKWKDSLIYRRCHRCTPKMYQDIRSAPITDFSNSSEFYSLIRFLEVTATYRLFTNLMKFDFDSFNRNNMLNVNCIKEYTFIHYQWLEESDSTLIDELIRIAIDDYELNDIERYSLILSHINILSYDTLFLNKALKDPIINFLYTNTFSKIPNKSDLKLVNLKKLGQFNSLDQYILQLNSCYLFSGESYDKTSLLDNHYHKTVVFDFDDFSDYCREHKSISITMKQSQEVLSDLNECLLWYATLGVDTTEYSTYLRSFRDCIISIVYDSTKVGD